LAGFPCLTWRGPLPWPAASGCVLPKSAATAGLSGVGMIELADVIGELRRELQQAMQAGEGELLRFEHSS